MFLGSYTVTNLRSNCTLTFNTAQIRTINALPNIRKDQLTYIFLNTYNFSHSHLSENFSKQYTNDNIFHRIF